MGLELISLAAESTASFMRFWSYNLLDSVFGHTFTPLLRIAFILGWRIARRLHYDGAAAFDALRP
jgi:hypothetical protein